MEERVDEGEKSGGEVAMDGTQGESKDVGREREELPGVESAKSYVGMGLAAEIFSLWMGLRVLSEPDGITHFAKRLETFMRDAVFTFKVHGGRCFG